jgi:hypothetical protein
MADYAKTGFSRVFLIDGGARPDHAPVYQSCLRAGGISKGFGDITTIYCPSPVAYDQFVEVDSYRGAAERATTSLMGRYLADTASALLRIAEQGCGADVHIHIGKCTDPTKFNTFTKAVVLEGAYISSWSTDELGALSSDERNPVGETAEISAKSIYEILPLSFGEVASSVVTNEVLDVVICDAVACGECEEISTGCQHIYAITKAAGGSGGTAPDIVWTTNGSTWYATDIDELSAIQDPSGIACLGDYICVVSNTAGSLCYATKADVDAYTGIGPADWSETTAGFVGAPNDCFRAVGGIYMYVCGQSGYVYRTDDPTAGVTVLDAGAATTEHLHAIMMLSDEFGVSVGANGAVVYTEDGVTWTDVTGPVGAGTNLTCVWCVSETTWFVGTGSGALYYTLDKGANWVLKGFPGSGTGVIYDISFASTAVGYLSHATAASLGRILRTYDGGYSWNVMPEGTGAMPDNDRFTALSACIADVNFVVGVGLGANGADGIIVVGAD